VFFSISMEIEVSMQNGKKTLQLDDDATGEDLISKLGFSPDEVILIVGRKIVPYTSKLGEGDVVKIVRVASGG